MIADALPSVERVRFVSTGTEACMSALRLARAVTGRDRIVKCAGNYHGHSDALLSSAGSGPLTLGAPDSPGVPEAYRPSARPLSRNNMKAFFLAADPPEDKLRRCHWVCPTRQ